MPAAFRLSCLVLLALAAAPASAQRQSADVVAWSSRVVADGPGEARLVVAATVAEGWRLYAIGSPAGRPLTLALDPLPPGVATAGALRQSRPREGYDEGLRTDYTYHEGAVRIEQPLRVTTEAAGRHRLTGTLRYAVCNDSVCLRPSATSVAATLRVRGGAADGS